MFSLCRTSGEEKDEKTRMNPSFSKHTHGSVVVFTRRSVNPRAFAFPSVLSFPVPGEKNRPPCRMPIKIFAKDDTFEIKPEKKFSRRCDRPPVHQIWFPGVVNHGAFLEGVWSATSRAPTCVEKKGSHDSLIFYFALIGNEKSNKSHDKTKKGAHWANLQFEREHPLVL